MVLFLLFVSVSVKVEEEATTLVLPAEATELLNDCTNVVV